MDPSIWFIILLAAFGTLVFSIPLILLLTSVRILHLSASRPNKAQEAWSNSQESVILPYDPGVSISANVYSSTAVTTLSAAALSPVQSRRRSLVTEYFTTVLGVEKIEPPALPPVVVNEDKKAEATNARSQSGKRPLKRSLKLRVGSRRNSLYKDSSRSTNNETARMWNILSAEIALVYHNTRKNLSRRSSTSSVKSVSVISEEGFQLEEDSEENNKSPTLDSVAGSSRRAKRASFIIREDQDVPAESESRPNSFNSATSTPVTPRKVGESRPNSFNSATSTPVTPKKVGKGDSLSRRLGRSLIKQGSMRKKGKNFLASLEDLMQKTAARKAAACLEKETEKTEKAIGTAENCRPESCCVLGKGDRENGESNWNSCRGSLSHNDN